MLAAVDIWEWELPKTHRSQWGKREAPNPTKTGFIDPSRHHGPILMEMELRNPLTSWCQVGMSRKHRWDWECHAGSSRNCRKRNGSSCTAQPADVTFGCRWGGAGSSGKPQGKGGISEGHVQKESHGCHAEHSTLFLLWDVGFLCLEWEWETLNPFGMDKPQIN